ncbi:MAG: nitrous oxide reductase accessory protein NosL [Syntrophobacteraceae bacterium]
MRCTTTKSFLFLLVSLCAVMGPATAPPSAAGDEARDILDLPDCEYCGMHRQAHAHSRMLVVYADGTAFGACSIYCAALNLVIQIERKLEAVWVADYDSKVLVRAEGAYWVIGGAKPGVMTSRAKWAFKDQKGAKRFISENGGSLATFDDAMRATFEDMYRDTKMIRTKKKIGKMDPY